MNNINFLLPALLLLFSCVSEKETAATQTPLMQQYQLVAEVVTTKTGKVKKGEGLFQVLGRIGINDRRALDIINALSDEVEFSTLKVGDEVKATFNSEGLLKEFHFAQNMVDTHKLKKEEGSWIYSLDQKETRWVTRIVEGELKKNSTLEESLLGLGLSTSVSNDIVSILLCKVNFRMSAREGDSFKVLLKERKFENNIIETKVLYTSYKGRRAGDHETFRYEDEEKSSTYTAHYTEEGEALIRSGLRFPLSSMHVRSNYGWRRHPVTGRRAFHRGIDLRGRSGRSVYAVAAGEVIQSNYNKFAGNRIAIRHRDKSTSYYFHLRNRIAKKGNWVKAGDLIGRVGSTGRVTGAHLHFGFKNSRGRWINPLNKRMIATPKLTGERLGKLQNQITDVKSLLAKAETEKIRKEFIAMGENENPPKNVDKELSL